MQCRHLIFLLLSVWFPVSGCSDSARSRESPGEQRLAASDASAVLTLSTAWSTGYCAEVRITNTSGQLTPFWKAEIDLRGTVLASIWDGRASPGTTLSVTPELFNAALPPDGSASFGFCASRSSPGMTPLLVAVSADPPPDNPTPAASIRLDNDWNSGYCATVTLANTAGTPVYGWQVSVQLRASALTQIWSATSQVENGILQASPLIHNSTIAPGSQSQFGFCAAKTGTNYLPEVVTGCFVPSDLSVHYLGHEPRFPLTIIDYDPPGYNPRLSAAAEAQPKWPDPGDSVTYTAHVENQGSAPVPATGFRWLIDGAPAAQGELPPLAPGEAADPVLPWTWQDGSHLVRFELASDACPIVDDGHVVNNSREQRTNAVLFTIYTWPGFEDWMATHDNPLGTRSGADWIQYQADEMNRLFELSRSDIAPDGVLLRIAVDRIVRVPEETPYHGGHAPPEPCPTDSCWAFGGPNQHPDLPGWLEAVDGERDNITLHEWGHQIGLLDIYRMDVQIDEMLIIDGVPEAVTRSDSSAGDSIGQLFDGVLDQTIATYESRPVWFAVEFSTPRRLDRVRMRFDSYVHQWQVVSAHSLEAAIAAVPPAVVHTPWVLTENTDFGAAEFAPAEARVWLVRVERLDGDQITHVNEWELYDGDQRIDVNALAAPRLVAGTPLMPVVEGDVLRYNSTYPNELMGGGIPFVLSPFHQWALNLYTDWEGRGLPLRRGWFGQYIFHVPSDNAVIVRRNGAPLAGASVEVFQQQDSVVLDLVKYAGTTDASGRFEFPKQTTLGYAQAYGLTEPLATPSPFSTVYSEHPDVGGNNSVLVLRITDTNGERAYRFLDIIPFNLAYADGNVESGSYMIDVGALP